MLDLRRDRGDDGRDLRSDHRIELADLRLRDERDARGGHADHGEGDASRRQRRTRLGTNELLDAGHEMPSVGGVCDVGKGTLRSGEFGQCGERDGEPARFAQDVRGEPVGDEFAFDADAVRQPPRGRVVEQQGFGRALQQVHQVIVAADVRELMRE